MKNDMAYLGVGAEIEGRVRCHEDETDAFGNRVLYEWNSLGGFGIAFVGMNEKGEWDIGTKGFSGVTAGVENWWPCSRSLGKCLR